MNKDTSNTLKALAIVALLLTVLIGGGMILSQNTDPSQMQSAINTGSDTTDISGDELDGNSTQPPQNSSTDTSEESMSNANRGSDSTMVTSDDSQQAASGTYTDYDSNQLSANKQNVLFFHASWCPTCRRLDSDINQSINNIPEDVQIFKVDYDNSTQLKRQYGVTYQHTLVVVDENGNQLNQWNGSMSLEDVLSRLS